MSPDNTLENNTENNRENQTKYTINIIPGTITPEMQVSQMQATETIIAAAPPTEQKTPPTLCRSIYTEMDFYRGHLEDCAQSQEPTYETSENRAYRRHSTGKLQRDTDPHACLTLPEKKALCLSFMCMFMGAIVGTTIISVLKGAEYAAMGALVGTNMGIWSGFITGCSYLCCPRPQCRKAKHRPPPALYVETEFHSKLSAHMTRSNNPMLGYNDLSPRDSGPAIDPLILQQHLTAPIEPLRPVTP